MVGGGSGASSVRDALQALKHAYLHAIVTRLQTIDDTQWKLRSGVDETASFILAVLRGLLLEWVERGDPGGLGLMRLKDTIRGEFVPVA